MNELAIVVWAVLGTSTFLIVVLVYMFVKQFEKIEYIIGKICSLFKWLHQSVRKSSISLDIQAKILKASKQVAGETNNVMPYHLKIKWVKETNMDTFLENNQIIVRMSDKQNKSNNMIYAINEYITKGLIPKARKYIDKNVMSATDLMVARKIVLTCWEQGLDYFDTEYLDKIRKANQEVDDMIKKIKELDETFLLYSVLIREFQKAGHKVYPAIEDECLIAESKEFLRFLYNIASKEPGEYVDLNMDGVYSKVRIVIIGIKHKMKTEGITPYCKQALNSLNKGTETIYLLSDSIFTNDFISRITNNIKSNNLNIKEVNRYRYKRKVNREYKRGECVAIETLSIHDEAS